MQIAESAFFIRPISHVKRIIRIKILYTFQPFIFKTCNAISGLDNGGNTAIIHEQDSAPADGQNHYRISVFDENGHLLSRTYTTVSFEHVATFDLFPNPANRQVSIQLSELLGQQVRIEVFNQIGQPVYQKMLGEVVDPIHNFDIDHWRDGLYQVIVFPKGKRMVSRQLTVIN